MRVMGIDPGNRESAYCVVDLPEMRPVRFGKVVNEDLIEIICTAQDVDRFAIERVACYGMPVGREVFDTCEWIGRYTQIITDWYDVMPGFVLRMEEKERICHDARAGDANIRRALIDRFATHDLKNGKGTKKEPDWFFGFASDVWAAYAVALVYCEREGVE